MKAFISLFIIGFVSSFSDFSSKAEIAENPSYTGVMKTISHVTIQFPSGSAILSSSDRTALQKVVADARTKYSIDEIKVAAWSDFALPKQDEKLSDVEEDLAKNRLDSISTFLKDQVKANSVTTFNMAQTSNWLSRAFNTKDAELKSQFAKKGAPLPVTNAEFLVIRNEGGPSKAVVVVQQVVK